MCTTCVECGSLSYPQIQCPHKPTCAATEEKRRELHADYSNERLRARVYQLVEAESAHTQLQHTVQTCALLITALMELIRQQTSIDHAMKEAAAVEVAIEQLKVLFDRPATYQEYVVKAAAEFWGRSAGVPHVA